MPTLKNSSTSSLWNWFPQVASMRVLEIGCGAAEYAPAILGIANLAEYVGVDLDEAAIKQAQARLPDATFICGDASRLASQYAGYFDSILIRRPDIFARPQNWMRIYALLPTLLKGKGRVIMTTIGASEAETTQTWLESSGLTIMHSEETGVEAESFLTVAEKNDAHRPQLNVLEIDTLGGEGMYCDPVTGICYIPLEGDFDDARQS